MKILIAIAIGLLTTVSARAGSHFAPTFSTPPTCAASDPSCLVLEQNQSYDLADGGVLAFIAVPEDSRCPLDAVCFWQGRVAVELKHQGLDACQKFEVGLGGNLQPSWIDEATGLKLSLEQVWPDKLLSAPSDEPYRIKLKIEVNPDAQEGRTEQESPAQQEESSAQQNPIVR